MPYADDISPLQRVADARPSLTGAALRVAELILADPVRVTEASITDLARRADTSAATVSRLVTSLGFGGFAALRTALATEHGRGVQAGWEQDIGTEIRPDDDPRQVLQVLAGTHTRALRDAVAALDLAAATALAEQIVAARRVHIYGEWGDEIPAREFYFRLLRIGIGVWFHNGTRSTRVAANLCGTGDVALAFSRGGEDAIAVEFLSEAAGHGAHTAVITGGPDSTLAQTATTVLFTGTRRNDHWTDFFGGRASDALTAGLLWVLVAQRLPEPLGQPGRQNDPEAFPVTHPAPTGD